MVSLGLLDPDDEGITLLLSVSNYTTADMV
jgi:hypothetical protein